MPDVFTKQKRSEVMSRIRSRGNKETEIALMEVFRQHKITGWRRHVLLKFKISNFKSQIKAMRRGRRVPLKSEISNLKSEIKAVTVRPDFIFPKLKLAVLVDGCFWHGCPKHSNLPVGNRAFWRRKLAGNRERDLVVNRTLRRGGWRVVRIWEHELVRKNRTRLVRRIQNALLN